MSDESPTRRISQIFGSLSCLSDLQHQEQLKSKEIYGQQPPPHSHSSTSVGYKYGSNTSSSTSTTSSSAAGTKTALSDTAVPLSASNQTTPSSSSSGRLLPPQSPSMVHQTARIMMGSRSTPNSPRLMPKRQRAPPAVPQRPNAAMISNPALASASSSSSSALDPDPSSWSSHFSSLTDHLDVRQVNNYNQGLPEINWQERCLELQLELHRSKSQASRIRDMLRDKVSLNFLANNNI